MMKQKLLGFVAVFTLTFSLSLGLSSTASAFEAAPSSSLFDQLHDLFNSGTQPIDADLLGWRTGRCYRAEQPSLPINSMLAGWSISGANHGPIAPPDEILYTMPVHWQNGAAGAFDDLTPEIEASVGNFIESQKPGISAAVYDHGSIYGSFFQSPGTPWILRKNQDYVVAEMIQNGNVAQMCYYFKVVRQ
jgi:hypothetical protein